MERKNRTLQEMARIMMLAKDLPFYFELKQFNTACHIHDRVTIRLGTTVSLYEMWRGRKPNVQYFHVFGFVCYIIADRDQRRKLDPECEEGIFLRYSRNSRAYRVLNSRANSMMESIIMW